MAIVAYESVILVLLENFFPTREKSLAVLVFMVTWLATVDPLACDSHPPLCAGSLFYFEAYFFLNYSERFPLLLISDAS